MRARPARGRPGRVRSAAMAAAAAVLPGACQSGGGPAAPARAASPGTGTGTPTGATAAVNPSPIAGIGSALPTPSPTTGNGAPGVGAGHGGQQGPPPTPSAPPGGAVHQIGPADSGKTVVMHVGDVLDVVLGGSAIGRGWLLMSYPQPVLREEVAASATGRYEFVATATGSGRINFSHSGCGPVTERPCRDPVVPPPVDPTAVGGPRLGQLFTVFVQVS